MNSMKEEENPNVGSNGWGLHSKHEPLTCVGFGKCLVGALVGKYVVQYKELRYSEKAALVQMESEISELKGICLSRF
jgi:hypothetical protein